MNNDLLDLITLLSFILQVANYNENLSQSDKADIMRALDSQTKSILERIENDLAEQNKMMQKILDKLEREDGH